MAQEKFVAEIWRVDEDGEKPDQFCGFWHGADDLESMLDKGQAFVKLVEEKGMLVEEHSISFKKGRESVVIRVDGGMECRIIPASKSRHWKEDGS